MNRKTHLIDAAFEITKTQGVVALTLDAVAERAHVSKGGLLYHFPTKRELLVGMIDELATRFDDAFQQLSKTEGPLRAYILATLSTPDAPEASAIVAAIGTDMSLLEPLKKMNSEWTHQLTDGAINPVRVTTIQMAVDGLWYSELFGMSTLTASQRQAMIDDLLLLAAAEKA